ncbi:MAG: NYN domain-containing protein [Snowella sp.]|nr:NYN domain-containing protein [Snowella sp.]
MNTPAHAALLLVDGYNIIGSWSSLKLTRDRFGLEMARDELIETLINFTTHQGYHTQIVFDSQYQKTPGSQEMHGPHLSVYFTDWMQTADTYIEKRCASYARKTDLIPARLIVATSDRAQQLTILGYGAEWMSAKHLAQAIESNTYQRQKQHRTRPNKQGRLLAHSLDEKVKEKFSQWRHG